MWDSEGLCTIFILLTSNWPNYSFVQANKNIILFAQAKWAKENLLVCNPLIHTWKMSLFLFFLDYCELSEEDILLPLAGIHIHIRSNFEGGLKDSLKRLDTLSWVDPNEMRIIINIVWSLVIALRTPPPPLNFYAHKNGHINRGTLWES